MGRIYEAYYKKAGGARVKTLEASPYYSMGGLLLVCEEDSSGLTIPVANLPPTILRAFPYYSLAAPPMWRID